MFVFSNSSPNTCPKQNPKHKGNIFKWKIKSGPPPWWWYRHGPEIPPSESSVTLCDLAPLQSPWLSSRSSDVPCSLCMCYSLFAWLCVIYPSGFCISTTSFGSPSLTPTLHWKQGSCSYFSPLESAWPGVQTSSSWLLTLYRWNTRTSEGGCKPCCLQKGILYVSFKHLPSSVIDIHLCSCLVSVTYTKILNLWKWRPQLFIFHHLHSLKYNTRHTTAAWKCLPSKLQIINHPWLWVCWPKVF